MMKALKVVLFKEEFPFANGPGMEKLRDKYYVPLRWPYYFGNQSYDDMLCEAIPFCNEAGIEDFYVGGTGLFFDTEVSAKLFYLRFA